jgi:hypothetical protein
MYIYSDEAWFTLNGYINSEDNRYWSTEDPHAVNEVPVHSLKVGVWYVINAQRIIGPIFFYEALNAECYVRLIDTFL